MDEYVWIDLEIYTLLFLYNNICPESSFDLCRTGQLRPFFSEGYYNCGRGSISWIFEMEANVLMMIILGNYHQGRRSAAEVPFWIRK